MEVDKEEFADEDEPLLLDEGSGRTAGEEDAAGICDDDNDDEPEGNK